ncbi:MAG: NrdH-redoxin [Polyangiaceae bacterium]|nr:NrdH-redoxin [Polyangiaceae bacterium]
MRGAIVGLLVLLFVTFAVTTSGCSRKKKDDGTAPVVLTKELPALTIRDDTPNLLLTWMDEKGELHVELDVAGVPAEGRSLVRVVVSDREAGTKDAFYVVDLTTKGADGGYTAKTMSRRAWEGEVEKRRAAYIAKVAPPKPVASAASSGPQAPDRNDKPPTVASNVTAILYGASWCKPCHDAEKYLKSKGVRIVHKDIEEDRSAALEMREKLEKSGQRGGSIPVIDIRGQILVGYSPHAIDRALGTAL